MNAAIYKPQSLITGFQPEQIGEMLTLLRKTEGLTQAELGARMGISQSRISQIESKGPKTSQQLCDYLNALAISWRIMKWSDPSPPNKGPLGKVSPPRKAKDLLYRPKLSKSPY
jgi:transcriptional regulator with XRE-family HTH domain